jgi:hypothetical protein
LAIDAHVRLFGWTKGVVHAIAPGRVERDAVGRICRQESGLGAVQEAADVVRVRRIPAQEAVVTEGVKLARFDVGLLRELRHVVGVDETGRG